MATFTDAINKICNEKGYKFPNQKQLKFLEIYLLGAGSVTKRDALIKAGLSGTNHVITRKLECYIKAYNELQSLDISSGLTDKKDLIDVLKEIIKTDPDNRLKIMAIQTLSKLCGYDAPIKTENKNEVIHTIMKFLTEGEDNQLLDSGVTNGEGTSLLSEASKEAPIDIQIDINDDKKEEALPIEPIEPLEDDPFK